MTARESLTKLFDKEFSEFECMRMYPPEYSKEIVMAKPKLKHCSAIVRAINLLETGINVAGNPVLSKSIQKDVVLLAEVKEFMHNLIENPSLPFAGLPSQWQPTVPVPIDEKPEPILDQIDSEPD